MKIEEVKLIYRNKQRACDRPKISNSKAAFGMFASIWDQDRIQLIEEFKALFIDRQNRLMSVSDIAMGGISGTYVDLRVIFAIALKRRASSVILAHNHPSGSLMPSRQDVSLTKKICEAGEILNIPVLDHLIITNDGFNSVMHDTDLSVQPVNEIS